MHWVTEITREQKNDNYRIFVRGFPLSMDKFKTKYHTRVVITGNESRPSDFLLTYSLENKRRDGLLLKPITGSTQTRVSVKHSNPFCLKGVERQNHWSLIDRAYVYSKAAQPIKSI